MTYLEFKTEFNRLYNNLSSGNAPGVDDFDISMLLTEAQETIVKAIVGGKKTLNILGDRFEITEDARRNVDGLVKTLEVTTFSSTSTNLSNSGVTGKYLNLSGMNPVPNIWWIVEESITADNTPCGNGFRIDTYPLAHDEYNVVMKNPYKRPNTQRSYRMDTSYGIEIHTPYSLKKYTARYVEKPSPIIVANLTLAGNSDLALYYTTDLSVDGVSIPQTCALNTKLHRAIIQLAVQTAILRYKEHSLVNTIQTVQVT